MDPFTTEDPSMIVMDEDDDFGLDEIETTLTSQRINHEKLAANIIVFLWSVMSGSCTLITVIRTKSVRGQLLGVMLINLAVAVVCEGITIAKTIETEFRGGIGNFGTIGCHLYFIALIFFRYVINASIITVFLDSTFNLPQSRKAQIIGTLCIWVFAMALTAFKVYGILQGPTVMEYHHNLCAAVFRWPYWVLEFFYLVYHCIVPSCFTLVTLIRFCCTHRTNKASRGKKLPFVLSAVLYLILTLLLQVLFHLMRSGFPYDAYLWFLVVLECIRLSISLIWLLLIPDLRNKCLCREISEEDSIELLE